MPSYLVQASYTSETVAAMVKQPMDRSKILRAIVEKLGGSVGAFWFSFGEFDVVGIVELPDNVAAVSLTMVVSAGGAFRSGKTTPLISVEDGMNAMSKAGAFFQAPASAS
jgi:uncharacterized protein with GYD domain